MKLYYSPGACSLSPHIVLRELGLPFEAVLASTKTHKLTDGTDYYTINPKGYVPLLVLDDGTALTEGSVILQYLAGLRPGVVAPAPDDPARWKLLEVLAFISTEIHKGSSLLWNPAVTDPAVREILVRKLGANLALLDGQLADASFLVGDAFSVVDAYLFVLLNWMRIKQFDLSAWPRLVAYHARLSARPSIAAALQAEGLKK